MFNNVQVNVKSSSADTSAASYIEDIAAIRVSQTDITGAEIETAGVGIAVVNEAVELDLSSSSAGDIGSDGKVTNGKGIYRDSGTSDVFRDSLSIHETVGVTQGMIDEGYRDSDGMVFSSLVAVDNTVTGADLTALEWATEIVNEKPVVVLSGDINSDTTLSSDNLYAITGEVNVLSGNTLTIPEGTTLFGATGNSYLAINRGAQIDAQGSLD